MTTQYKCPDCQQPLELHTGCGSESYYCKACRELKSRARIKNHPNYISASKEK